MKLRIIALIVSCMAIQSAMADVTGSTKATATLSSSCQISAQNVNFGNLDLMAAQSGMTVTGNMNILCTLNSTYKITLAFGGIYGQVNPNGGDYWTTSSTIYYYHYSSTGQFLGQSTSQPNSSVYTFQPTRQPDGNFIFTNNTAASYSYGELVGAAHGDTIGYKITVPGNDNTVWNGTSAAYTGTGTGAAQSLPIKTTVQTGSHGSLYPTPDIYMDTVTATINF